MRLVLTIALSTLVLCAPALAQTAPEAQKVYSETPTGKGDPNAITCRPPQTLPGLHLKGHEVCKTNAAWRRWRIMNAGPF